MEIVKNPLNNIVCFYRKNEIMLFRSRKYMLANTKCGVFVHGNKKCLAECEK